MLKLSIYLEKIPGKGEDSRPITDLYEDGSGLMAVFDGLGGSGSTKYELGGKTFTGAWFASRMVKSATRVFFKKTKKEGKIENFENVIRDLEQTLDFVLEKSANHLDKNPSKLKSKLIRRLPTTASCIYFEQTENDELNLNVFWTGDSRSWCLGPAKGLQQLTFDDTVSKKDALASLYSDSRISQCISADSPVSLHTVSMKVEKPILLITGSDGCFDYVQFPAHFEFMVLDSLLTAKDMDWWQDELTQKLKSIASDDVTLGLMVFGWKDLDGLKNAFRQRHTHLNAKYILPFATFEEKVNANEEEPEGIVDERTELRERLWREYKKDYELLIPKIEPAQKL